MADLPPQSLPREMTLETTCREMAKYCGPESAYRDRKDEASLIVSDLIEDILVELYAE